MAVGNIPTSSNVFSIYAQTMMNRRGVSDEQRDQFADIMQRAEGSDVKPAGAKDFVASLSDDDLEILRKVHSLADKIEPGKLDIEGAYNLLREPGDVKDLNDDACVSVGIAKGFSFPPPNAPQSVKDAWEETTADMSESERMLADIQFFTKILTANIVKEGDSYRIREPGEPGFKNPYASGCSYKGIVRDMLYDLERLKNYYTQEDYEEKKGLLDNFAQALENNNCP